MGVEKWLRLVLKDAFVSRWDSANAQTTRTNRLLVESLRCVFKCKKHSASRNVSVKNKNIRNGGVRSHFFKKRLAGEIYF